LIDAWRRRAILLFLAAGQIDEVAEVLSRPKIRKFAGNGRLEGALCPSRTMRPLRSFTSFTPVGPPLELTPLRRPSIKNTRTQQSPAAES